MSNKKNIASILMLGATTVGLTGSMSTSAGLFDFLNWKEAKERDAKKNEQGYKTAEKVAKIFLEKFNNEEGANENKEKKNVIAILEDLVLEKLNKDELEGYYKKKFENMTQNLEINLEKDKFARVLNDNMKVSNVQGIINVENSKNIKDLEKIKNSEKEDSKKEKDDAKNIKINANEQDAVEDDSKKKEKSSFFGCLGKAIWSIKDAVFGKESKFVLELYGKDKKQVNVDITYTKISDLTKYMSKLEEKLLENPGTEAKEKKFNFELGQVEELIKKAKSKGISYEKIINNFFKKLEAEGGGYLFANNPLTETLWNRKSQNAKIVGNTEVEELGSDDKAILHELGYERNNSRFWRGARWVGSIVLTSAVVAGLSAAFPVIAGIAAAPIGVALTGVMATIVDRVVFKTRFKEYRKMESWHPKNWEVQRFLKDTVRNTITSAMWALSIGRVLPSFF